MDNNGIMRTPRSLDIALTGRCNLKCEYCFYADEMVALQDLPTEEWLTFFQELAQLGVLNLCLTGGEAFSHPDLFELIDGVIANRMRYNILSNGTLITEATIEQFKLHKRLLRLDFIQISIDGSTAEVHDQSRPNSFKRAVHGLRLLKAAGFPLAVRVTINKHNVHDLKNIAELLLDDIGLSSFGTNEAVPLGAACQGQGSIRLDANDMVEAMETLERLNQRYPGRLQATAGPQAKLRGYREMEHARLTGEKTNRWGMGYLTGCGCVFSKLSVLHDGTIVPCHLLYNLPLGKINVDSVQDIWLNHPTLLSLRTRRQIPMQEVAGCKGCKWADYCNGSCPALAYELTGDFNRANPVDCYRRFLKETGNYHVGHH
jgi:SynChlorMet cassette radical SAM/SPASM protein ScmE